jgi:vitamin B12 transporter
VSAAEEVVVTASRVGEPVDDLIWSVTVLDREEIETRQAASVQELLAGVPGVTIDNAGGLGKVTSIFLRGGEGDHTLLLIDGMRTGSATVGTAPFELVPLEQVERIEIVRGPRSTLYGSDAVGGVIQIFTRQSPPAELASRASAAFGSHGLRSGALDIEVPLGDGWFGLGLAALDTDGINACLGRPFPPGGGCFTNEPDADGFRSRSGSLALGRRFGERWSAELRALLADARTEFDGTFTNLTDARETAASLRIEGRLGSGWNLRATLGRNDGDQSNLFAGVTQSRFDTSRDLASVQLDGAFASGLRLVTGVDVLRDRIDSTTSYDETSRSTTGLFGELRGERGRLGWLAGARFEDNEQFGSHVTGNVGAVLSLGREQRLTATWGTAFKAPSFNELYFPGFGNRELEPEESRSVELGLDGRRGPARWSAHVFDTRVTELIAFDLATFRAQNVAGARIRGAELQGAWRAARWSVAGQVSLLRAESRTGVFRGNDLQRRARESASLELRRLWAGGAQLGAAARWSGPRFNDLANTTRLGGFFTLDLTAQHTFARAWTVQARVANLFDRDYSTADLFTQDGRHYGVTLRYTPAKGDIP